MTSNRTTTLRIPPALKKAVMRIARSRGLTFSQIACIALRAIADGIIYVNIGVSEYPDWYIKEIDRESEEIDRLRRQGKLKTYSSAKKLFDDILDR